jgi:hypothetical protein
MTADPRRSFVAWLLVGLASFVLLAAGAPASAAGITTGSGKAATETRAIAADFEAISATGAIDVVVRQGARQSVEVHADDNLLPLIETVVESSSRGPTLVLRFKRSELVRPKSDVRITVDVVRLTGLSLAGSGDVTVHPLKTPSLRLAMSGSGNAKLQQLDAGSFEVRISGSGDVLASGSARQVKLGIAGSGSVGLKSLIADDVSVSIAGSGDAKVFANKALKVSIAGSGDVEYGGAAETITTSVAGSGQITRR